MSEAPERIWHFTDDAAQYESVSDTALPDHTEYIRADLAKPSVKPLVWRNWGGEWDANNPVGGTFTVKICGNSGYYLFTSESNKATDFWEVVEDRSTPDDCIKQAHLIVERRILEALE